MTMRTTLAAAALLAFACTRSSATPARPPAPRPPAVTVAAVEQRTITEWDEFSGRLEAVDSVEVRPRVSGYIQRIAFVQGAEVRKGDLLFQIDRRPYQAELSR